MIIGRLRTILSAKPRVIQLAMLLIVATIFVACSDDSGSSAKDDESLSSSSIVELSSSSSATCEEIRTTKNDFVPLENVLPCVNENEKVAFVVRHGERNYNESGYDDTLNANGVIDARALGSKLKEYPDFYYMHTNIFRTLETGYRIAEGKGQSVEKFTRENCDSIVHEFNEDLVSDWYYKDESYLSKCASDAAAALTKMAYEPDDYYCSLAFYNAKERTQELVERNFIYSKMHDITFAVTHDFFVAPLLISVTDGEIGLDYHNHSGDGYFWPNFLSGVAFIVDDMDRVTMVPVKGLASGRLAEH